MTDERHGCPSASILGRLAQCPGSWRLSQLAPPAESTPEASSGTRIHDALATGNTTGLTSEEETIRAQLDALEVNVLNSWLGGAEPDRVLREERLWRTEGDQQRWSAKPDQVVVFGSEALVLEYKTGPLAVEDAAGNLQLRAQAAVVHHRWPEIRRVTVVVLQPRCSPQVSQCAYAERDLKRALDEIDRLVARAQRDDAPLVAGEAQCRYCAAKPICPQAQAEVTALVETNTALPTPAKLADLLDRCVLAEKVIESIRDHARHLLGANPNAVPGWQLAPGRSRETIVGLQRVFERVNRLGVRPEVFVGACSLTKKALKTLLQEITGDKGSLLDARLGVVTDGCVEQTQTQPMLVRQKGGAA